VVQRSASPASYALPLKRDERFNGCANVSKSKLLELRRAQLAAKCKKSV
jgi:hypothetical protein